MAADNALVTPLVFSHPRAIDKRTQDKQQAGPQAIPVSVVQVIGELVKVKAEVNSQFTIPQTLMPQAFSQWVRPPTQVGDKGFAVSADFYLGGQSGLGGGTANLYGRANLSTLVFMPVSQKSFSSRNLNQVFINGPQGVLIQDQDGHCTINVTATTITLTDSFGNKVIMESGKIALVPSGEVYLGGDGTTGSFDFVQTVSGASTNVKARYA